MEGLLFAVKMLSKYVRDADELEEVESIGQNSILVQYCETKAEEIKDFTTENL